MITAVDTSILIDIALADPKFGLSSAEALRQARLKGKTVICPLVYAEFSALPVEESEKSLLTLLEEANIVFDQIDEQTAHLAGRIWRSYRNAGGKRSRIISDFLIGAHASVRADLLLTRDRGFYRKYFKDLRVIEPSHGEM